LRPMPFSPFSMSAMELSVCFLESGASGVAKLPRALTSAGAAESATCAFCWPDAPFSGEEVFLLPGLWCLGAGFPAPVERRPVPESWECCTPARAERWERGQAAGAGCLRWAAPAAASVPAAWRCEHTQTAPMAAAIRASWQPASFPKPFRLFDSRRLQMPTTPFRGGQR